MYWHDNLKSSVKEGVKTYQLKINVTVVIIDYVCLSGIVKPVVLKADPNKRTALSNQLQRVADFISYLEN